MNYLADRVVSHLIHMVFQFTAIFTDVIMNRKYPKLQWNIFGSPSIYSRAALNNWQGFISFALIRRKPVYTLSLIHIYNIPVTVSVFFVINKKRIIQFNFAVDQLLPANLKIGRLTCTKLVFISPNTTSFLQLMDGSGSNMII